VKEKREFKEGSKKVQGVQKFNVIKSYVFCLESSRVQRRFKGLKGFKAFKSSKVQKFNGLKSFVFNLKVFCLECSMRSRVQRKTHDTFVFFDA
jgi:hypothetical protein